MGWSSTTEDLRKELSFRDVYALSQGEEDYQEQFTAPPGEWISAGYTGEGMVHAWMSGKALAYMLLGADAEIKPWFPEILRISEERWKKANLEDFITKRLSSST